MIEMKMIENLTEWSLKTEKELPFGEKRDSLYIVIPITIIYLTIFFTGLLGNICTCIIISRNKSMHTATNYYLFNLAVSDLLLLISGMPQEIYSIWSKYPYVFGETFCVLRGFAAETSANASVLTIASFTIERYLAICHPFLSYTMSKLSRAIKIILFVWTVAILTALPQALQFGLRTNAGNTMCLQVKVIIAHSFEISSFVFFFIPMILITVLYLMIGIKLSRSKSNKTHNLVFVAKHRQSTLNPKKHGQSTRRVIKMLVAVVAAFFICWAPFHAQRLIYIYGTKENNQAKSATMLALYSVITYISGVFHYLSTTINPILYHTMSKKFRDAFKSAFSHWTRLGSTQSTHNNTYSSISLRRNTGEHSGNTEKEEFSRIIRCSTNNNNKTCYTMPTSNVNKKNSFTIIDSSQPPF